MNFNERLWFYAQQNCNFGIHYDKIYRKEYLPSRIRYNQFFFYVGLAGIFAYLYTKPHHVSGADGQDLSQRRYFTSDRAIVNFFARQYNRQAVAAQVKKQEYTF